ncbi:MAG: hypothetical protein JXQ82_07590 [Methanomicrobiaceae archaeon]|nr:hypothetical protein [Methanomicrobiaceae archaeon]
MEADLMTAFLSNPIGVLTTLFATCAAIYQTYKKYGIGQALSVATNGIANLKASMSRSSTMVTVPEELNDTPDAWKMSPTTWQIISANLGTVEKAKLRNVIDEKEGAVPPVSCYDLATSKGTYTILNGAIDAITGLDAPMISTTVDAGKGEIFRVWGGIASSASNVPQRQDTDMEYSMSDRSLYVSVKPVEVGGVTLGIFADGKLVAKKICDFKANDMDQAKNDISFPTYDFQIPKEVIQEVQHGEGNFDLVVALAEGGKWYFLSDDITPWSDHVSIKVTLG